jgi:microcystin-dependent protein
MRSEIPIVILDNTGHPVVNASVSISIRGGAAATIYQFETGTTQFTNPLTTDAAGRVTGWVERGAYDAVVSASGLTTYTEQFEAVPARDGAIDTAWLADQAVTTPKIADGSVTAAKLAGGAVSTVGLLPVGSSFEWDYAPTDLPTWAVLQYGQQLTQAAFPTLYGFASNASFPHGGGAGVFNVADKRGRFSVGKDDMGGSAASRVTLAVSGFNGATLGAAGGVEGVTLTTAQLPAHNHPVTGAPGFSDPSHGHSGNSTFQAFNTNAGSGSTGTGSGDRSLPTYTPAANGNTTGITVGVGSLGTSNAGSGSAHQNMPPAIIVNKAIRAL